MKHRKLERQFNARLSLERDEHLHSVLSKNPSSIYKTIKRYKRTKAGKLYKLTVGKNTYFDSSVKDGFYESISKLKTKDSISLAKSEYFSDFKNDFDNIIDICRNGDKIPEISEIDSLSLLQKLKPAVSDLYGMTPNHYLYAGPPGWKHFHLLLNSLINDVNNTSISKINTAHAIILFKGHGKDRSKDRSYRTISSCPLVAKALDLHIRNHNIKSWNRHLPETQFQHENSSHELAAILLTESIQHSLFALKLPAYILYLDAQSAFDVVLRELLIKNLYNIGTNGNSLLYLNNRLENRQTFIEWDNQIMGPIFDQCGLEQGGVSSSELYRCFGAEQLNTAQKSQFGVSLGANKATKQTISAIGQADDTALISNSIQKLYYLLKLTKIFCDKYQVKLCAEKTKLQVYYTKEMTKQVEYSIKTNPISVDDIEIEFVSTAEHVGIVRATSGNLVTIYARITAHKKSIGAILHTGMSRNHRCNPQASLRIEQLYGIPVLLSGIGSLVLSHKEENLIDQHHKEILTGLQRLHPRTPRSVIYFLAGSLPGIALIHLKQLSLFGMICRLPNSILHKHAINIFSSQTISPHSWFHQIRDHCLAYGLPHPLKLLTSPLKKDRFKKMIKSRVIDYWEKTLRAEAEPLLSLTYLKPSFMSLTKTHPLWSTAGCSPSKVAMATIQARMVSGRYRTEYLCRHWSSNKTGVCLLSEQCKTSIEDLPHILCLCPALQHTREKLVSYTLSYCNDTLFFYIRTSQK